MFSQTSVQRQLPRSSSMGELSVVKQNLVDEMSEFTREGDRVNPTDSHIRLAEELVHSNDTTRYAKIPFGDIIRSNQDEGHMDMMATAFDVLFRYTVNMLKLKRPRNWHTIKFTNAQFKARADCMIGTRNILNIMGYTQPVTGEDGKQNGLSYPDPSQIVQDYIKLIAAELLIAKTEIKLAQERRILLDPSSLPGPYNVQLENPNPVHNLDEMYASNVNPSYGPPQTSSRQFPSQQLVSNVHIGPHDPSRYGPIPPGDFSSQYYRTPPSSHTSEDSYHTNPSQGSMDPSLQHHQSFQHPNSYAHSNISQPLSNQHHGAQSGHQYDHQLRGQGSQQHDYHFSQDYHSSQDMVVEDVESISSTSAYGGDTNDMSAKLEELKRKKADIWKYFDPQTPSTGSGSNLNPPVVSQPQTKPRSAMTTPIAVLAEQPRASGGQPPVPKPRRSRQPPANPPPSIKEDESLPFGTSDVAPSTNQGGPPQRPQAAPRKVRTMMECDMCEFYNHEKSMECMECGNPKNERWRKIQMPGKPASVLPSQEPKASPQPAETVPVSQASIPPSSDSSREAPSNVNYHSQPPSNTPAAVNNAQYRNPSDTTAQLNNQPTATGHYNNQTTTAGHYNNQQNTAVRHDNQATTAAAAAAPSGATGGSDGGAGIIAQGFLPPPKYYTPEQKKMLELKAAKEKEAKEVQQEQQRRDTVEQGGAFQNFMPRNDKYISDHQQKGRTDIPTGRVCPDTSNDSDPLYYKNLGTQGQGLIQDIKEGLKCQYMLEEIQLASEMKHGYRSHCDFLLREWNAIIERTSFRITELGEEFHRNKRMTGTIGKPKRKEIVTALIDEHGDSEKAAQRCCTNRIKMIQRLMSEVGLPQSAAVIALERNDLDMDKAVRDVYRQKINSNALYAYIWGELEGGGIRKTQNDRVKQMIKAENYQNNYLQRLLMAEYKLPTTGNCDVLIHLVRQFDFTVGACLDVAMMNDKVETAVKLLTQECPICTDEYMRDKMINMIHCDHAVCKECFVSHFSVVVGEKSIKHFNCLVCGEPDMSSETIDMDLYLQLFSGLIQAHMSKDQYDLFTKKINERTMMKDPKFLWCIKCTIGFINDAGRDKVECPNPECKRLMCFKCKKPWENAHDGLTCEEFAAWKKDNDPELQAQGLAAYLNEEGIECPACKFKYALAKGGCMHFKCNQCPAEFCSGCGDLFKKDCTKYESCRNKGLHAHHPRDCLFYLRDESVDNLQKLLNENNAQYDTEPPKGQVMAEARKGIQALQGQVVAGEEEQPATVPAAPAAAAPVLKCRVMLQKETPDGPPIDEECGDVVENDHAGLCLKHYKEYLVYKINQNHIDPLPLYDTGPLRAILMRDEVKVPDQQKGEGEEQFAERLRQHIKEKLPLQQREAKNF